jgi:small GTP-binding protein
VSLKREYVFKILMLGDTAVGKTSLIDMYLTKKFADDYHPTLGTNIITKKITIDGPEGSITVVLVIWDIAGQEKYKISRVMYFSGCSGALFVYDITRNPTFENIESNWLKDYQTYSGQEGVFLLIGNKIDLKDNRGVPTEKGKELANKINAQDFIETSAKYGENVEKAFEDLVRRILTKQGVGIEKLKREIPITTAELIGEYKGLVKNRVVKALLQAYHDILDYDGMKSILREAGELDLRNIHAIDGNKLTKFFAFKKVMAAQNCLLYGCDNLLFEIGKKFAFYLFPFGKEFEEIITDINNLIQTDWTVEILEMSEDSYTLNVKNCIFCTETGVTCDLFEGFLVHSLQKTLPANKFVSFERNSKDPFDPNHNNFTIKLKIENLKT